MTGPMVDRVSCFVCDKHRGEVDVPGGTLFEDDLVYVSHGKLSEQTGRGYPGVLFIEPKRHVDGYAELSDAEAERIGLLAKRAACALEEAAKAVRVYTAVAGHHVPHFHMWVVPRYEGAPKDAWGIDLAMHPESPRASAEEIEPLCGRIRDLLSRDGPVTRDGSLLVLTAQTPS